jgi:hypothetical protein
MDLPSGEFAFPGQLDPSEGMTVLTMYSQKSLLGKDMMAWKEYGPDPWGTTGMS